MVGAARPGRRAARGRRGSRGCCGRPTTPRSRTCGRSARTSTRSPRAGSGCRRCLHARGTAPSPARAEPAAAAVPAGELEPVAAEPGATAAGQRRAATTGCASACGSAAAPAGLSGPAEIPLVGVVQMDEPAAAAVPAGAEVAGRKPRSPSRGAAARKKAGTARANAAEEAGEPRRLPTAPAPEAEAASAAPAKRPRARARKKAE